MQIDAHLIGGRLEAVPYRSTRAKNERNQPEQRLEQKSNSRTERAKHNGSPKLNEVIVKLGGEVGPAMSCTPHRFSSRSPVMTKISPRTH